MWTVKNVIAQNFMSFGHVEYDFQTGCTIIKAENNDDEGQESNGGGKTSFIDILPICILGQSLTGRNLKECVNWRTEDKFFTVSCELVHSDGRVAIIMRKVFNNTKSAELYVTVDDEAPKGVPKKGDKLDVNPGNTWILDELLDISREDLLGYYLISSAHYTPYFKASPKNKVEIINRFSKADKIDIVLAKLEQAKTSKTQRYESINLQLESLEGQQERLDTLIATPMEVDTNVYNDKAQVQLDAVKGNVEALDHQILHYDTTEVDLAMGGQKDAEKNEREVAAQANECTVMIQSLKVKLSGSLSCPSCDFEFIPNNNEDVKELNASMKELTDISILLSEDTKEQRAKVQEIRTKVDAIRTKVNDVLVALRGQRDQEKAKIYPLEQEVKKLEGKNQVKIKYDQMIAGYRGQYAATEEQHKAAVLEQGEVKDVAEDAANWETNFNDFKFFLANKPIKIISGQINHYLQANKSDMVVHIEGFKKLKSGEMKQQLNPIIYRNGEEGYTYDTFSGGERVKLNISADLAFQELINSSSKSGGLNYYCNDELLNSLDSLGIGNAAEAFDQVDKTILLVSHSGADLHYEKTVNIVKENGKSEIK